MKRSRSIIGIAGGVMLFGAWYAFRPERAFIDATVNESFAAETSDIAMSVVPDAPQVLSIGMFHGNAHHTKGTATIYQNASGDRTLRLTGFETSNGPDVRVYLVASQKADDSKTVKAAGYIDLGALKGNIGDQNYIIPDDVDLARYRAVVIWCRRFSVNFGSAQLMDDVSFTVRIENVSTPRTLKLSTGGTTAAPTSPGVWAIYSAASSPLFTPGKAADPNGLERQAEEGNASALLASLGKASTSDNTGIFAIPVGSNTRSGLAPGKAYEFSIAAKPGSKLSFTMMFAESNDIFLAPADGGIALFDAAGQPVHGDVTSQVAFWDAGTEVNEEPGVGPNQAHRQKAPNTGKVEHGVVHKLKDGFTYPQIQEVIRVTITPAKTK